MHYKKSGFIPDRELITHDMYLLVKKCGINPDLLVYLLLTQKVHSAPITQQAGELASHAQRANDVPVNFS
jgi:hypothetical protein